MVVTNTAMDADIPQNLLSYVLSNPPPGATIDSNGIITWTPSTNQALIATSSITTIVTDNGFPSLSATNTFVVTVRGLMTPPVITSISVSNGIVSLTWSSVPGYIYKVESASTFGAANWLPVGTPITATDTNTTATDAAVAAYKFYRVSMQP
jgi:hypothetical protein